MPFVELDRTFKVIPLDAGAEDLDEHEAIFELPGTRLTWSEVLDVPRVIVLAEAGCGKTEEFKERVRCLTAQSKSAFYLEVQDLHSRSILEEGTDSLKFRRWMDSEQPGWFFLDSVDEARLNRVDFVDALAKLSQSLGSHTPRAKVIVSCRVSDWRGSVDAELIRRLLPVNQARSSSPKPRKRSTKNDTLAPTILKLMPLNTSQRLTLLRKHNVSDPEIFLESLSKSGLSVFSERPADVLDLCEYWQQHKRFGSYQQLVDMRVGKKLEEDLERASLVKDELTISEALKGSQRLAAGLTLTRSPYIRAYHQRADPSLAPGAADSAMLLPDWDSEKRGCLLRRAIFTPATYGRIKFHHRSTQEYLTGSWVRHLSEAQALALFFDSTYGHMRLRPSLAPVAAWCSLWFPQVETRVVTHSPYILIAHGDPASLSMDCRRRTLLSMVCHPPVHIFRLDRLMLERFSSPELADTLRYLWRQPTAMHLRPLVIELIGVGKILGCCELLDECIRSATEVERVIALQAMEACGYENGLRLAASNILSETSRWSEEVASHQCRLLFPNYLTVEQLVKIMKEVVPNRHTAEHGFKDELETTWARCPRVHREALLKGIVDICRTEPRIDYSAASQHYRCLAENLTPLARAALQDLPYGQESEGLILLLQFLERVPVSNDYSYPKKVPLNKLLEDRPDVQRRLFWVDYEAIANAEVSNLDTEFNPLWFLTERDLIWLRTDLTTYSSLNGRRRCLVEIVTILGRLNRLKSELTELSELAEAAGVSEVLELRLVSWEAERKSEQLLGEIQGQKKAPSNAECPWGLLQQQLCSNPPKGLPDYGNIILLSLGKWLTVETGLSLDNAVKEWRWLGPVFGQETAEWFRDSVASLWRQPLSEGKLHRTWFNSSLELAIELDPDFSENLKPSEVYALSVFAAGELSFWPDWLRKVADRRVDVLRGQNLAMLFNAIHRLLETVIRAKTAARRCGIGTRGHGPPKKDKVGKRGTRHARSSRKSSKCMDRSKSSARSPFASSPLAWISCRYASVISTSCSKQAKISK